MARKKAGPRTTKSPTRVAAGSAEAGAPEPAAGKKPAYYKVVAALAAVAAVLGGIATLLGNLSTVATKPAEIATQAGLIKPKPVSADVGLATLSTEAALTLILGKDFQLRAENQRYALVDGVYCVPGSAMGHCPGASAVQRGRYMIEYSLEYAFDGPFGPAVPIFDIVSVRPDERDILLVRERLDYELIEPDATPYVEVVGLDDNEGRIELVSHCKEEITSIELTFGLSDVISKDTIEAWHRSHPSPKVRLSERILLTRGDLIGKPKRAGDGVATQIVDLRPALRRHFPDKDFQPNPELLQEEGSQPALSIEGLELTWSPKPSDETDSFDRERVQEDVAVIVVGRMKVTSRAGHTYEARIAAPVIVKTSKGYGGAGVMLDSRAVYVVDDRVPKGSVVHAMKLALTDANPTVRSHAAVVFKRSGRYRLRFVYATPDNPDFMSSKWIVVQAFASPEFVTAYTATDWQ